MTGFRGRSRESREQWKQSKDNPKSKGKSELRLQLEYKEREKLKFKDPRRVEQFILEADIKINKSKQIILEQEQAITKNVQDKIAAQLCYEFRDYSTIHRAYLNYLRQGYEARQENLGKLRESIQQNLWKALQNSKQSIEAGKTLTEVLDGFSVFIEFNQYWPSKEKLKRELGIYGKTITNQIESITKDVQAIAYNPEFIMRSKDKSIANLMGLKNSSSDAPYEKLLATLDNLAYKVTRFNDKFISRVDDNAFRAFFDDSRKRYENFQKGSTDSGDPYDHLIDVNYREMLLSEKYLNENTIAGYARRFKTAMKDAMGEIDELSEKLVSQLSKVLESGYHN